MQKSAYAIFPQRRFPANLCRSPGPPPECPARARVSGQGPKGPPALFCAGKNVPEKRKKAHGPFMGGHQAPSDLSVPTKRKRETLAGRNAESETQFWVRETQGYAAETQIRIRKRRRNADPVRETQTWLDTSAETQF